MKSNYKFFGAIAIVMMFGFSAVTAEAQVGNNPIRITISGIDGFNGGEGLIALSTSNDIDNNDAFMADGTVDRITAGSATFSLVDMEGRPFTRAGRYYIFLLFYIDHTERAFVSFNQHNITNRQQHLPFNFDVFYEIDF